MHQWCEGHAICERWQTVVSFDRIKPGLMGSKQRQVILRRLGNCSSVGGSSGDPSVRVVSRLPPGAQGRTPSPSGAHFVSLPTSNAFIALPSAQTSTLRFNIFLLVAPRSTCMPLPAPARSRPCIAPCPSPHRHQSRPHQCTHPFPPPIAQSRTRVNQLHIHQQMHYAHT